MSAFLAVANGCSLALYAFVVWRFFRVHRAEAHLLATLQEEGTVRPRSKPILFAVSYGVVTVCIIVASSFLLTVQPHWL